MTTTATTPESDYEMPILEVLVKLAGSARCEMVLERVEHMLREQLSPADYEPIRENGEPLWRNRARWARNKLRVDRYLRPDSPHAVWEITPAGRRYYEVWREVLDDPDFLLELGALS